VSQGRSGILPTQGRHWNQQKQVERVIGRMIALSEMPFKLTGVFVHHIGCSLVSDAHQDQCCSCPPLSTDTAVRSPL
jgi:hypothetical protein